MGARFSEPIQTGHGAHPASYKWLLGLFPGVSSWGVALTTHPQLKGRVELYLYSLSGPSLPVPG